MSRVMLTATEARAKSLQDVLVLREIRDIEEAILEATANGDLTVIITDTSTMANSSSESDGYTLATEYFSAWAGVRDDRQKLLQMEKVTRYFSALGYAIERRPNTDTQATFKWTVSW